ncbi:PilT/PilU family type 4a pilus ATPase [Luteolibacter arcticus]|uniref:PilT/PilU family type 4a pilus ATPase n=1 Tax=Luteolibacter arcticus TaxID=1581411 RepID=A0ABT3GIM3_9BACT|nr:PilT/PilU family type 4a pilus ATPase [Luteolibacter arcticus]MCW1923341.1 PilT/PilU family type 4a pilus ATPase [Luteolibacter arcticus]
MAVIDTFLKLMMEKRAERLVLVSDAVPYLLKGGETIELSMPAFRADMLGRIAGEITGDEVSGRREGTFRASDGAAFGYAVLPSSDELRIEIHAAEALPPAVEDHDPLTKAVADFAKAQEPVPTKAPSPVRSGPDLLALIDQAAALDASDLFLSSGKRPRVRRNGVLSFLDADPPDAAKILELIPDEESRRELEVSGSTDFATRWELSGGSRRFRINVFRHRDGVAAALRPIRQKIPPLADLGLPEDLLELISYPSGLVLVTGTTGSGKSTTLAALVDHLNRTRSRHVITIEDPVEYEHRENQCLIHQREVGSDVESFSTGLRAALRENPDVILLGELRDLATITAALTAAETGHLVLATLHSGTASSAVNRIVDVFPGHQQPLIRVQLASSLRAVLSQRLVPTKAKKLMPAIEKLIVTPAVATGIREGQDHYLRNAMLTGVEEGMVTLERSLAALVRKGTIDRETAARHAMDPKGLQHLLE